MAREYRWSLLFLWIPTLVTATYYTLIAADLYASEARFVVRTPSRMQATTLTNLLQSTGITRAQDDVFSVHDFVMSRDAIVALKKHINLGEIFGRPEADFLARYPNPLDHGSEEDFFDYYLKRVSVAYDSTTGISTLLVKAFRSEDAKIVADRLLTESEALVNQLNERAHRNAVRDAETDVKLAQDHVLEAQLEVLEYRNRESMLDPTKSSGAIFETLAKMQAELTMNRARLAELDRNSPGSPLKSSLETRIAALEQQINRERARLAGSDASMAPKIAEYERLILKQDFAAKALASAAVSMEAARAESRRQQIYLDRVVEPDLVDKARYPKRLMSILTMFVSCFLIYSIGKLLIAGVREHVQE
jgi:capsular polysaccharide transport system permease protein